MMRLFRSFIFLLTSAVAGAVAATRILLPSRKKVRAGVSASSSKRERKQRFTVLAKHFALFVGILAVGGFLVAASGIVSIKASSGHWAVTRWFLSFSSQRSVATHTIGGTTPELDKPSMILRGAGHYETGCRPCHGSPDLPQPRIAAAMTPHPPYLPPVIPTWDTDELFYIVKHGIKFTGMPAWPAQERDDEVWAVVAFLLAMQDMDAAEYDQLVNGPAGPATENAPLHGLLGPEDAPQAVTQSCGRCHGLDGLSRGTGAFPKLAGQSPSYLYAALRAYAEGRRHSGIMEPVAAGLSAADMRELALYYGTLQRPPLLPAHETRTPDIERGRAIVQEGIPEEGIPSCMDCHGPGTGPRNPFYPELAGQYAEYIEQQLSLFKQRQRGGSAYAHIMHVVAERLTQEDMRAVALYYASLTAERGTPMP